MLVIMGSLDFFWMAYSRQDISGRACRLHYATVTCVPVAETFAGSSPAGRHLEPSTYVTCWAGVQLNLWKLFYHILRGHLAVGFASLFKTCPSMLIIISQVADLRGSTNAYYSSNRYLSTVTYIGNEPDRFPMH